MSTPVRAPVAMTVDEFLRFDRQSSDNHEFVGGLVYAMRGASGNHNRIGVNIVVRLMELAGDGPCRVYHEGFKLRVGDDFYCPDVMAVCAPGGDDQEMAYAPCLVVEIISPTTGRYDRVEKADAYARIPSVRTDLLVEQELRFVTRLWRETGDAPWQREYLDGDGAIPLPCPAPGSVLTLDAIYRGITLPELPPLRRVRDQVAAAHETTQALDP